MEGEHKYMYVTRICNTYYTEVNVILITALSYDVVEWQIDYTDFCNNNTRFFFF